MQINGGLAIRNEIPGTNDILRDEHVKLCVKCVCPVIVFKLKIGRPSSSKPTDTILCHLNQQATWTLWTCIIHNLCIFYCIAFKNVGV